MSVFNSLGSNYWAGSAIYALGFGGRQKPEELKQYLQNRYKSSSVFVTYKGREAIAVILKALQLPADSYVAVNGFTCYAVYQAIVAAGLRPYYLDIEKNELNFGAETLRNSLIKESHISVVMIQNTFGIPCDIQNIKRVCAEHKVPLVEDLAHCIGMRYSNGEEAGSQGFAAALSFSQDKMVDAVTGGAAIFKNILSPRLQYKSASLIHRFKTRIYPYVSWMVRVTIGIGVGKIILRLCKAARLLPGPMSGTAATIHNLPSWHSHITLEAYSRLAENIAHHQDIATIYRELLTETVQLKHSSQAIYLRFPILVHKPYDLISYLKQFNIYIGDRWYDAPVGPKKYLALSGYNPGQCPNAEYVAEQIVNLPTHINIDSKQARLLAERVNEWLRSQ